MVCSSFGLGNQAFAFESVNYYFVELSAGKPIPNQCAIVVPTHHSSLITHHSSLISN